MGIVRSRFPKNQYMKILFVDDEFILLEGLQLRLLPICQEWEIECSESGADALARMALEPFDVVVADMRMPGMSGPELLAEVMDRYPQTARILLTDQTDETMADPCAISLHEVVSKNCAPEDLKAAIARACQQGEEAAPAGGKLEELMAKITRLPSIPSLYFELVDLMRNPDADIDDIGRVIARDMTMTAAVLKMANSAFFGLQRVVTNTTEATMYLGIATLRSLVLSVQIFSQFESKAMGAFSVEELWSHSLEVASAARSIARAQRASKDLFEEAFVTGVLHDIGKLVLASNFAADYDRVLALMVEKQIGDCSAEKEVFGVTHAEVGGRLLRLWGLPFSMVEAVELHHEPGRTKNKTFAALTAIHAANVLVHEKHQKEGVPTVACDREYLEGLGMAERLDAWRDALEPEPGLA